MPSSGAAVGGRQQKAADGSHARASYAGTGHYAAAESRSGSSTAVSATSFSYGRGDFSSSDCGDTFELSPGTQIIPTIEECDDDNLTLAAGKPVKQFRHQYPHPSDAAAPPPKVPTPPPHSHSPRPGSSDDDGGFEADWQQWQQGLLLRQRQKQQEREAPAKLLTHVKTMARMVTSAVEPADGGSTADWRLQPEAPLPAEWELTQTIVVKPNPKQAGHQGPNRIHVHAVHVHASWDAADSRRPAVVSGFERP